MDEIKGFFGDFRFLSNFWLAAVVYKGTAFPSTEAAYQAAKTLDPEEFKSFRVLSPCQAKHVGHKVKLRPDWDEVRLQVMYDICLDKFTRHIHLQELPLMTGDVYLEERNTWNDTFWGVFNGEGENNLGKTLMRIRDHLRARQEEHSFSAPFNDPIDW